MSLDYDYSEQSNSALEKMKRRAASPQLPPLTAQTPTELYTMPRQTLEQLERILRSALALQDSMKTSMATLATKESLQPLATAEDLTDWTKQMLEYNDSQVDVMEKILSDIREEGELDGKRRDEFTKTLSSMTEDIRQRGESLLKSFRRRMTLTIGASAATSILASILICLLMK